MNQEKGLKDIFCKTCKAKKETSFCDKCQKETANLYNCDISTGSFVMTNASVEMGVKRGDISWAYFPLAYTILITISIGIIQFIEIWEWWLRLVVLLLTAVVWLWLCFFNGKFRRYIIKFFTASKNLIEK